MPLGLWILFRVVFLATSAVSYIPVSQPAGAVAEE
ncbi:Uncharacterised protein [Corynebacterium pilosum]|uniref:Uncharacterized protein n=1 Tax=Corynebacterium pilosum TaxID=35756 RepID=A0A376CN23_9CORY|nr:Uncharacterised protein [Corynebacterium pilosum]